MRRKLFIIAALVVVGSAVTPAESQAGCGLLSRLFEVGRGGCGGGSSFSVVRGGGCASGQCGSGLGNYVVPAIPEHTIEITSPATCPDGKCANASAGVLQIERPRFRLFR